MDCCKEFDTRAYLATRYPANFEENPAKSTVWDIEWYHMFYESFKGEWDNSNAVLLQLGAGPCIYDLISAAPYVAEVYHTDYFKCCCDEVLLWRDNNPNAYDWSPYFRYVVNKLEGKDSPHAVVEREELLRSIIKDSFTCDVQQSPIVLPSFCKVPDIICTNFCLESSPSYEKYTAVLKNLFEMLKPNGFLVMIYGLGITHYVVNGVNFPSISLNVKDIENALKKAGFTIRFKESREFPVKKPFNDTKGQAFIIAQKVS